MIRGRTARIVGALVLLSCLLVPMQSTKRAEAAGVEGFAHPAIRTRWSHDDGAVANGSAARPWLWGPGAFYTTYEPYEDTPQGNHLVQYFDKGRLEVNDPAADRSSSWFVTSGLLVKEMVSGAAKQAPAPRTTSAPRRSPWRGMPQTAQGQRTPRLQPSLGGSRTAQVARLPPRSTGQARGKSLHLRL